MNTPSPRSLRRLAYVFAVIFLGCLLPFTFGPGKIGPEDILLLFVSGSCAVGAWIAARLLEDGSDSRRP